MPLVMLDLYGWSRFEKIDETTVNSGVISVEFRRPMDRIVTPVGEAVKDYSVPVINFLRTGEYHGGVPIFRAD